MSLKFCPRCDARFRGDIATCPIDGTSLREPEDPFIGRTIAGRYLVEEELGSGGMGTVYRARHQIIGRDVALKFLDLSLTKNERQRKRFLGEARAANQINHEHIIDITDFGETEDGLVYMVMEYLEGRTLADEIDKGPLPARRALRIATQMALGLARAHELGVVHRDIKPANIYLVRRKADADYVKILDFGVARIEKDMRITGQGTIVGTPEYIAPEQIRTATASPLTDLYALGCVLFEMLTGRLPFEGKTTMLLVKHLNDPPPLPSDLVKDIPKEVDALVLRLLAKDPADRFRDAYHLVEELQGLLDRLPPLTRLPGSDHGSGVLSIPLPAPIPSEEDSFVRTVKLYRQLSGEAHPEGDAPAWLPTAISYLEGIVNDVKALRERLRSAAQRATQLEEDVRGPRALIGRALDELAQDDSRLGRQITALETDELVAEERLDKAMGSLFGAVAVPAAFDEGQPVTRDEAEWVQRVFKCASGLSGARDALAALRIDLEQKRHERRDLRFQIEELKEQLSSVQSSRTIDQEFTHEEVNRISAQIKAKLEAAAPYASRVSTHFGRFPEMRVKLSSDVPPHSSAPAPARGSVPAAASLSSKSSASSASSASSGHEPTPLEPTTIDDVGSA